jgi:hypothetical protein
MSILSRGQRCVIIAGCPANIGLVVEVIARIGKHGTREDAYWIRTVSGRPFNQLWMGKKLKPGSSSEAITDRHKLRPLVDTRDDELDSVSDITNIQEFVTQP